MSAFGIYLHWPFCLSKCPYCDFNSHVAGQIDQARWRRALLAELEHFHAASAGRTVTSIFFGGGTPSLMDPATAAALLQRIAALWPLAADVEITLEANPGSIDAERFRDFRGAGIGRLSMGLQALNDADLRFLGRRHDVAQAVRAVTLARAIFPRISFDLIYARPGQDSDRWRNELGQALALAADHLSLYQLTVEPGTAFHPAHQRGDFQLPDDDEAARLFELTQEMCAAAGLPAYEISNHARPGAECRHNLLYWQGDEYLGIGPGAHGRLRGPTGRSAEMRALRQCKSPGGWLERVEKDGHGTEEILTLTRQERLEELVMMGLRLTDGIDDRRFAAHMGSGLRQALDPGGLALMQAEDMVAWQGPCLRATPRGRLLLNQVIAALLPQGA
ncbi:oxygen-independent coproporphyrinogen-III oxidase-like protein YqeR [mine drainage metagenome]|uniref:Oxygen-independent coproporphyrinogen-III oxidase-like protein YqeR n=1 Tax=mine drainage metagenome TaxID=410659 RepID=A0A1J5RRG6_9ZZZZ